MNFDTINLTSMIWVLKTLQACDTRLLSLASDVQSSFFNNLPRLFNIYTESNADLVEEKIDCIRALKHVINWNECPENSQIQLLEALTQPQMYDDYHSLEVMVKLFSAILDIHGAKNHPQLLLTIKQYFLSGLEILFNTGDFDQDHFEEPLLDCLKLAKTMNIQWQECTDDLKRHIAVSIWYFTEDRNMDHLESMLLALAKIGATWSDLGAHTSRPESSFHKEITRDYAGLLAAEDRPQYIQALKPSNLNQWIEALVHLGLNVTDIQQQIPDLWQRYHSTVQGTMQSLHQFNRTWSSKGYEFPHDVLKKIGFFIHDVQHPKVAQLLDTVWQDKPSNHSNTIT